MKISRLLPAAIAVLSLSCSSPLRAAENDATDLVTRCDILLQQTGQRGLLVPLENDAAVALGLSGSESAVPILVARLKVEKNDNRRLLIVKSLGWLQFSSALPALEAATTDSYRHIPKMAAASIKKIKGEIPPAQGYKRSLAFTPGNASADAILEKCSKILLYGEVHGYDEPGKVDAVVTLGLLGDERAVPLLADQLVNTPNAHLRGQIVRALLWIGSRTAQPVLEQALKDPDHRVRRFSAEALGQLTGKKYEYDRTGEAESKRRVQDLLELNRQPMRELDLDYEPEHPRPTPPAPAPSP